MRVHSLGTFLAVNPKCKILFFFYYYNTATEVHALKLEVHLAILHGFTCPSTFEMNPKQNSTSPPPMFQELVNVYQM